MASAAPARPGGGWTAGRSWRRAARVPLPPAEAGRDHLIALLAAVRAAEGCETAWDDRRETSVKAVYRVLWRLGHAERSGCFASTPDQLVAAFMPVMGWPDHGGREANRSAHARSVRRWLDDLQAMGLIEWGGVRDNLGRWWRTEIRLCPPPPADARALAAARRRMRAFPRRERRRRARNPARRRDLGHVLGRSATPSRPARRRRARQRARALQASRVARRGACHDESNVSSNPYGAPPTVGDSDTITACHQLNFSLEPGTAADRTGERNATGRFGAADVAAPPASSAGPANGATATPAGEDGGVDLAWQDDVLRRVAAREAAVASGAERPGRFFFMADTKRRSWEALAAWPAGRRIPDRVLAEAFEHATGAHSARLGRDGRHRPALDRALARYRRWAAHRPPGWPVGAEAALALAMAAVAGGVAGDGEAPQSALYAIGRLNMIAKQMAAAAKRADVDGELGARRRRLERRDRVDAALPIAFRARPRRSPRFGAATETARRATIERALRGELPGLENLHGFLIRASDLLGDPAGPERRDAYRDALAYARSQRHRDAR